MTSPRASNPSLFRRLAVPVGLPVAIVVPSLAVALATFEVILRFRGLAASEGSALLAVLDIARTAAAIVLRGGLVGLVLLVAVLALAVLRPKEPAEPGARAPSSLAVLGLGLVAVQIAGTAVVVELGTRHLTTIAALVDTGAVDASRIPRVAAAKEGLRTSTVERVSQQLGTGLAATCFASLFLAALGLVAAIANGASAYRAPSLPQGSRVASLALAEAAVLALAAGLYRL